MAKDEFIEFTLADDPQVYKLAYDFNVLCDTEVVTGLNLMQPFLGQVAMSANQTRALLYACLKKAHPLVLLNEAGGLLSSDLGTVLTALGKTISLARAGDLEVKEEDEEATVPEGDSDTVEDLVHG